MEATKMESGPEIAVPKPLDEAQEAALPMGAMVARWVRS